MGLTGWARRLALVVPAVTMLTAAPVAVAPHPAIAAECAQPSHAWIVSNSGTISTQAPGGSITVPSSAQLTFAGVLDPGWGVLFQYFDLNGNFVFNNLENSAGGNCVLDQRSHTASQSTGGFIGTLHVFAFYETWEDPDPNDLNHSTQFLGTLTIFPG